MTAQFFYPWIKDALEGDKGAIRLDKFGFNPSITTASDPEDVWEQGGLYTYTADAGAAHYISSSDAGDTQDVSVQGLTVDSNGNWNLEETIVTLSGQTKTQIITDSGDPYVRVFRMENDADSGNDFSGVVYVYEDDTVTDGVPDTATKIRASIDNGNNQTLMALYTVPTGYVGYLFRGEVGIEFTGTVGTGTIYGTFCYKSRRAGKVFKVKKKISTVATGQSNYIDYRSFPDVIPAKTDIRIICDEVSDTVGAFATFDILLVKEEQIPQWHLDQIGQVERIE